jgi:hypothetical protein
MVPSKSSNLFPVSCLISLRISVVTHQAVAFYRLSGSGEGTLRHGHLESELYPVKPTVWKRDRYLDWTLYEQSGGGTLVGIKKSVVRSERPQCTCPVRVVVPQILPLTTASKSWLDRGLASNFERITKFSTPTSQP